MGSVFRIGCPVFNLRVARDSAFLRQASLLFGGNAGAAALGLLSLSLTARALGVEAFGGLLFLAGPLASGSRPVRSRHGAHPLPRGICSLPVLRTSEHVGLFWAGLTK